jgi:uncharacterized phage protein (TIGR02220 family)
MAKDPAVLFYTADFLAGTIFMRNDQVGKYIKLLCMQHQQGHLKEEDMLEMCGSYDERIFSKFVKDENGLYYNVRMEEETLKRKKYSESRSNNRKGNKNQDMIEHMSKDMIKDMSEHMCEHIEQHMTPHMENENINENVNKDINVIKDIITYLNNKLNTRYKYTTKDIQLHIRARLNEGFVYEDFVEVIDKKYNVWVGTDMAMYLRPKTLFGTNFQSYLNEKTPKVSAKPSVTTEKDQSDLDEIFGKVMANGRKGNI